MAVVARPTARASRGLWRDALRRLMRNGPALVGAVCIAIFVAGALLVKSAKHFHSYPCLEQMV